MIARLNLTGFLESFNGEPFLLLQVQWKELRLSLPPNLMASSLLRIPYHSPSGLPPSSLDLERCFSAAEFSSCVSGYLDRKIESFLLDLAAPFAGVSPPSLYVLAEIETQRLGSFYGRRRAYLTGPLMPRRLDPAHQPQGFPLRSRFYINDDQLENFTLVRGTEEEDSAGPSLQAITKLRELKLDKEASEIGECSVCLKEMSGMKAVLAMPCDHAFHAKCILHWLEKKNTCPLCRSKLHD